MYIIKSASTGQYYIGSCKNITKRLSDHNSNRVRSTRYKGPFGVVHKESFDTRTAALKREKQVKRYKGGVGFKKLVNSVPIV